jgi:hypothetical protein
MLRGVCFDIEGSGWYATGFGAVRARCDRGDSLWRAVLVETKSASKVR